MDVSAIRALAKWTQAGRDVHKLPFFVLRIPTEIDEPLIVERIGEVSGRSDGRWDWRRRKSRHAEWNGWLPSQTEQGVAATQQEAMQAVEQGWDDTRLGKVPVTQTTE